MNLSLPAFIEKRSSFNPFVISVTLLFVVALVAMILIAPEKTQVLLDATKAGIFNHFSWFYVLAFSIFICFLVILSVSSLGSIKLGNDEEEPEFGVLSWLAMLFAAGMGVGLMFFGVAEPLSHYLSDITVGAPEQREQQALLHSMFHWGIHAWGVYGMIALALAYFGFRYKLPLALRSCFYPLFKERINGRLGLLAAFSDNIGTYASNILQLSFKTYTYEHEHTEWFTGWTILYWAWWCSWAPFVGLFIARISRGRTIREFIFGVLVIPSLFGVLWFTVFGNTAIWMDAHGAAGVLGSMTGTPEKLLFKFLEFLPMPALTGIVSLAVIALFFVTSADSGIYVLNNIASRDKSLTSPRWQAIMWGVLMSVVAVVLMREGGLGNLQTMTLIVALPFAMLMLLMCFSLWKGLNADRQYFSAKVHPSSVFWSGKNWHARLEQMMNQTQEEDILRFLKHTALPAMRELRQELTSKYGLTVQVNSLFDQPEPAVELVIQKESLRDFMYGIKSVKREVSEQLINDEHLPHIQHSVTYEPYTYFFDGRTGYDVQYMDHNELIADMLKQYERYLSLLGGVGQELMSHEQTDLAE